MKIIVWDLLNCMLIFNLITTSYSTEYNNDELNVNLTPSNDSTQETFNVSIIL